uniref:F-box domain-containing protein n=1 Tax=Anopheles coluzzii TaxID=1518534 RepID=A0A8W7Q1J7_ANOCL
LSVSRMEEVQQQQQSALRPSFPPVAAVKWVQDLGPSAADGLPPDGGQSFGQDSGYTSYQATTPNNTFNLSSRHGISSVTLATIDEAGEHDCSMNDTGGGGSPTGAINLTPKTAASMVLLSNIHINTPKSTDRAKRIRRPIAFDYDGSGGSCSSSFLAPTTPERLPGLSRSVSFELPETPLRTGNRSASQPSSQLTPHKARGGSLKRKHSTFREKLYSDGDGVALPADENDPRDLNDSLDADCRRLEDISPILNVKRRKHQDRGIEDLMRSSTPKTASSQPTFLQVGAAAGRNPPLGAKRTFRKFQSFSPSKMQPNAARPLLRQNAIRALEHTPEKRKEQRVLAEIHPQPAVADAVLPPLDLAALLDAPILGEPSRQLEQTVTTVPSLDDFSLTPSKANLIDLELMAPAAEGPFATDDYLVRHASNFSYAPTLNSILEESPIKAAAAFLPGKLPLPKTPPSVTKSGRKLKRLGTNGGSASSCASSPARSVRSLSSRHSARASVSPKATRRLHGAQPHNCRLKTAQPYSFCGCEYINILHQLSMRNPDALETLLDYLADTDLVQVVRVSRGWKAIIQNHKKSWRRLQRFLKQQEEHKENCHGSRWENGSFATSLNAGSSQLGTALPELLSGTFGKDSNAGGTLGTVEDAAAVPVPPPVPAADANAAPKRLPFKVCNSLDNSQASAGNASFAHGSFANVSGLELSRRRSSFAARASTSVAAQSPPVSPSMRKFVTNQKIASHLKQSEQLRPCPRCEQPSRIILSRASKSSKSRSSARFSAVGARLEKSYTLPDPETANASGHRHGGSNNTHSSTIETCDYAICSGAFCGFRFCIKCLCEYHPDTVCADLAANSPTKEEERGRPNMACSRQSRRSLQRLCRKL